MKKFLSLCLAAALLLSAGARAQVFDRLALGVGTGTDGLGLELVAPLGDHVDVRLGYGLGPGLVSIKGSGLVSVPEHPGAASSPSVQVPMKVKLGMNDARLLFNFYPGLSGFHFTVGAYLGSPRVLRALLWDMPADYNTAGLDVDGYLVKATAGQLPVSLYASGIGGPGFAVKPYVGIGFGRPISNRPVSFSFDLGAQYQGKPGVWAQGEGVTGRLKAVEITDCLSEIRSFVDDYGKYLTFWPTINFHVYFKLF